MSMPLPSPHTVPPMHAVLPSHFAEEKLSHEPMRCSLQKERQKKAGGRGRGRRRRGVGAINFHCIRDLGPSRQALTPLFSLPLAGSVFLEGAQLL